VHKLISKERLEERYRQINDFERYLAENDVVILKFFLHISKGEQKNRLEERLEDPHKRWKFSKGDLAERKFWDQYLDAYQVMLDKCSVAAPWFVIPADNKWYRDWAVSEIILRELKRINPKFPKEQEGLDDVKVE
jgi:polyphosphate kinase 2 (PPK2 family)